MLLALDNATIARALLDLADCMEVRGEATFKVRAFRGAARTIGDLVEPATELLSQGKLGSLRGVGSGVVRRVTELCETGDIAELAERRDRLPPGLTELVRLPGVGLKTAELLWTRLDIADVDDLEACAKRGELRSLPRFSAAKEAKLLEAVADLRARALEPDRWTVDRAGRLADRILEKLRPHPGVKQIDYAGSLRRGTETVGDIDILVAADEDDAPSIMAEVAEMPDVAEVLVRGDAKTSVRLRVGMQLDVRVVRTEVWGAAMQYFTGSKEHNVALRSLAVQRGLKVSEYGVFDERGERIAGATEEEVYRSLGLEVMPPELRQDRGEIERSLRGELPHLLQRSDLRGDLHMHTTESDGRATLREMAEAARECGLEYIAITDHSETLSLARGLDAKRLAAQGREIRALNDELGGSPRVLRGIEADILPDGEVDLGPAVLRELDWVVGSVHGQFRLSREEQTRRIVKALESGVVDCLGHPTGRMLGRRPGFEIDIEVALRAAARAGAAVELNASPNRLDLDEHALAVARDLGVPVVVNSDAHNTRQLDFLNHGTRIARRAWLGPEHVLNTRSSDALVQHVRARRPTSSASAGG